MITVTISQILSLQNWFFRMLGLVLLTVLVGGSFAADDDVCFAHVEVRQIWKIFCLTLIIDIFRCDSPYFIQDLDT